MIINTSFSFMGDSTVEPRNDSGLLICLELPDDRKYYYQEFKRNLSHIDQAISVEMLDVIRNDPDACLILCNSHEAFHEVVREIYTHVVQGLNIPEHKIILISESADIHLEVKKVASELGRPEIHARWMRVFEAASNRYLVHSMKELPNTLQHKAYGKKFINFNRRWRLHRPTLVALLKIRNLLDSGFVSLAPCDDRNDWKRIWPWMLSHHSEEITSLLLEHENEILNIPDLYLDTMELMTNRAELEETTNFLYENSYFSVVSETNFYSFTPGRFVSEKIFKPIAFKHPFILLSRPNTLELMRDLGYKTFSPWIDESYDLVEELFNRVLIDPNLQQLAISVLERKNNYEDKKVSNINKQKDPIEKISSGSLLDEFEKIG